MNKLSKIFLVIIIVLVLALCIMSYLYFNMRKSSKQNLDSLLTKSEELTNAYQRIDELEVINWEECEEARFFSKNKEIHFFREDDTLQAVKVSDDANEDKMDSMQKRYYLASKFRDLGQYVLVKEYLKYDE